MPTPDYSADLILDVKLAARARRDRMRRFQTAEVPVLRLIGFLFNAVAVIIHNHFVAFTPTLSRWSVLPPPGSFDEAVFVTAVLVGYSAVAWLALHFFWDSVRAIDLGDAFIVIDILLLMFVVYVSGTTQSLLWFVFVARAADQVTITFRRALLFAHLGPMAYLSLVAYVGFAQHGPVHWPTEFCKVGFLYILCLYISLTARAAEARRRKFFEARRIAEQAVRQADERRRALEDAMARLESANRAKSEFLANVSHELRTPLNSVIGTSDLLLDSALTRGQREMLGVVRESAEALTLLVNDILDLAKIEARRLPIESIPLRLGDVVAATTRMFAVRAHQKGLELICHIANGVPDGLLGDPLRLRQVLTNLIANAIKFTEAGEVVLRIDVEDRQAARVALRFSVRDTGIGIPKSHQQSIFEAFTQVDGSDTRKHGGTGLGLTSAAELVALMDGRMWVDSDEGRGSTFSFVAWFGLSTTETPEAPPWGRDPITVLVADRSPAARAALVEILSGWRARPTRSRLPSGARCFSRTSGRWRICRSWRTSRSSSMGRSIGRPSSARSASCTSSASTSR